VGVVFLRGRGSHVADIEQAVDLLGLLLLFGLDGTAKDIGSGRNRHPDLTRASTITVKN
jgi:hypothetical protein